jgi:pyruvate/2-oxoglutarate dehydrogenase complex dihydrolipoamide dehydrogenase (E3) component
VSAYNAIVIGAGPAGQHCTGHLADAGLRVAIVERERVGGECDYRACIPSKTLLRPGEARQAAREAPGAAVRDSQSARGSGRVGSKSHLMRAWISPRSIQSCSGLGRPQNQCSSPTLDAAGTREPGRPAAGV